MDYSSIHHDDNPAASPWASSPNANRTSFGPHSGSQDPPSPTPALPSATLQDSTLESSQEGLESEHRFSSPAPTAVENGESQALPDPHAEQREHIQQSLPPQLQQPSPQQPQQQDARPKSQQRYHGQRQQRQRPDAPAYKLQPKITALERPNRKDLILNFDIHTNLPGYRTTQFRDVRRTHAEFQKLADHLISANPEAFVPALPPSSTPAGAGTDEDEMRVKNNMQRWLSIVCGNEVLMRDDEMVRFIEGDPGYSPMMRRSQPATGVRRKVIKQFAPPPDDTPELMEARPVVKRFYLGAMDAGQKVDKVVKTRRNLGLTESEFGMQMSALTEQEHHAGLKNALRRLGKTIQTVGDLHAAQGTAEATVFADALHYHSADAFIVKETLTNRHILLRDLIQAQQATRSKLNATDRLKASTSVRRDKVDEAITALDEARSHESYLQSKTARVTHNLLGERRAWFVRTASDLRASIRELVMREIESERRALATLEAVRPDVRAIDASGGLSRLGREATPAARRSAVQSSQGPKGDAWSGVARRPDGLNRSISGGYVVAAVPQGEDSAEGQAQGRARAVSGAESLGSVKEDDADRVDARNAASRLATSTF